MTPPPLAFEAPTYWRNRNVFVTGCTGVLGSWLVIRLVELGANVVGLVRDEVPRSNLWRHQDGRRITIVRGSLTDYELMLRSLNEYEIDTIFHTAAQTIVPIANNSPLSTFDSNIRGTWMLLEAARVTAGVRASVVASSDKAYGESEDLPYREDHRLEGRTPYDVSKVCTDLLAQTYYGHYRLPVAIVRCGNIYGGGDLNWNRLIPGTIRACHFGDLVRIRSDGSPVRDYIYVRDVVSAYLAIAWGLDRPDLHGQAFNVSNEAPMAVREVAERICVRMGRPFEPEILDQAHTEIAEQALDSRKIRGLLGWSGRWSFDQALDETIVWYREFLASA